MASSNSGGMDDGKDDDDENDSDECFTLRTYYLLYNLSENYTIP